VALLIGPGHYHRIAERGQDSGELHRYVTEITDIVLLRFALALGVGVYVGAEGIFDERGIATAAGTVGTGLALALWYGVPQLRRLYTGENERRMTLNQQNERANTPLKVKIEQLLVEARVVLPGAQALFGFQLAIVLTESFELLPAAFKVVHAAASFSRARRDAFDGSGALSPDRLCRRGH
jgi:hypothetical protein